MPQDWFTENAPKSEDWFASNKPTVDQATKDTVRQSVAEASTVKPLVPRTADDWMSAAGDFTKSFISGLNPLPMLKSLYEHPLDTLHGIPDAQKAQYEKAKDSYSKGNYSEAVGHTLAAMIPLVGPAAAQAGETIGSGQVASGMGQGAALLAPSAVHYIGEKLAGRQVAPSLLTKNPVDAEAVRFGLDNNLPVDAATATGNPAVRGGQWLADRSIGGSLANTGRAANAAEQLASKFEDMAAGPTGVNAAGKPVYAGGPAITPEQAGTSIQTALDAKITAAGANANQAYGALRQIEAKTPMTVDLTAAKAALQPIYDQMKRQMPLTQQNASTGLKAIENIVNGPDIAPASLVDADLGAVKGIVRGADAQNLRNVSQGLAAKAVNELSTAVDDAIKQGGKPAIDALRAGRQATTLKYQVAGVLDKVREEPVQAFNQMVYSKDAGIEQLRAVAQHAPKEMPKVGSAFLNDILNTATKDGGFTPGRGAAKWQALGPETKTLLFKDPAYISDLDNFFTLSKRLAENPNPSGSGYIAALGAQGYAAAANPLVGALTQLGAAGLSKMLHSPAVVRTLVEGLKLSVKVPQTAATAFGILKALNIVKNAASENSPSVQSGPSILAPAQ
jgi:hypothetical protein